MTSGISGAGDSAEEQFFYYTSARKPDRAAEGDAVIDGRIVEIKQASSVTINQVRAVKYIPLVVLDTRRNRWFVVPPDDVVRLVSRKKRGQHTENPFESATLSVNNIGQHEIGDPTELHAAVLAAAAKGDKWPELRSAMVDVKQQAVDLATDSLARVREILRKGPVIE